ncbi:MAG: formaldehyde-activating enzyme [Methanothrix sp.]|nr:formaldehyde-activating enzyme [Methanothrix sp.]
MQPFDSVLIGEALVGEGPEIAHIDLVIGPKGSYVEQAFVSALASPAKGHTLLLAVLEPNLPAKPSTLMVNKVTIKGAGQAIPIFGPAQAAVAKAVMDCVAEGTLPQELAEELMINYQATKLAIERAAAKNPKVSEILAKKDSAKHPFA